MTAQANPTAIAALADAFLSSVTDTSYEWKAVPLFVALHFLETTHEHSGFADLHELEDDDSPGYARAPVTFSPVTRLQRVSTNVDDVVFPVATGDWQSIRQYTIINAAATPPASLAHFRLFYKAHPLVSIKKDQQFVIPAGSITFELV